MKRNFLLNKDQREVFEALTDEEAGQLIKGIFRYLDTNDSGLNGMLHAIFIPIKKVIDGNEEKYRKICEKNKENVRKRWNKDIPNDTTVLNGKKNDTNVYETIPNDADNNHISYINNHLEEKKDNRGMGEEEKEEPFMGIVKQIINHLNERANTKYRATSKNTKDKIKARLNEGYSLDDFIVVIDKKTDEWLSTNMQVYLRPETLFGTKFESYLNQPINVKSQTLNFKKENIVPNWFNRNDKFEEVDDETRELAEKLTNGTWKP